MLPPPRAIRKAPKAEVAMRERGVAWRQRTLELKGREAGWESLPEKVRKEAIALLSLLLLDYARAKRGGDGHE